MTDAQKKILVADDEEDIKMVLQMYLENNGYEVVTAFDGLDAVSKIRDERPDLVLMDIMMPVIDGVEVTRQIKADETTKDIPVIMLTAAAQSSMVEKAMEAGACEYIAKPFEPEHVQQAIEKILGA